MSELSLISLAAVRDEGTGPGQIVREKEINKGGEASAKWGDLLATIIPTIVISGYSTLLTILLGAIEEPTKAKPDPDQFLRFRIPLFAVALVATFVWITFGYKNRVSRRAKKRKVPAEAWAATVAFVGWGLGMPGTFLTVVLHSHIARAFWPLAVLIGASFILALFIPTLRKKIPLAS